MKEKKVRIEEIDMKNDVRDEKIAGMDKIDEFEERDSASNLIITGMVGTAPGDSKGDEKATKSGHKS